MEHPPRIFFLMRASNTGGTYTSFTQVQALNRLGFRAAAIYTGKDELEPQPDLPVIRGLEVARLDPRDVVVIDEGFREAFAKLAAVRVRKVLFNQQLFYGWYFGFETPEELNAYPLDAVMTASRFATEQLLAFGVRKPIFTVFPKLDSRFRPGRKNLTIAFTPVKRQFESRYVKTFFGARHPKWRGGPWTPLVNLTRQQCADAMSASFIYASFARLESLGLMSLEAMKSRCLVAGFDGYGGREYATPDNGRWIAEGDYAGFADALADLGELYAAPDRASDQLQAGESTAACFNEERFLSSLTQCWNDILGTEASAYRLSALNPR